jgi:uncharacterized membrane protein YhaH (DUF805 family)
MWSIFRIVKTNYIKTFNFKERQSRFDYWIFVLFIILITYVVTELSNNKIINDNISYLLFINIIPFFSSTARRLHDGEKNNEKTFTGLAFFVSLIIIGFFDFKIGKLKIFSTIWLITIVIFLCRESNPKANGYGKLENYK